MVKLLKKTWRSGVRRPLWSQPTRTSFGKSTARGAPQRRLNSMPSKPCSDSWRPVGRVIKATGIHMLRSCWLTLWSSNMTRTEIIGSIANQWRRSSIVNLDSCKNPRELRLAKLTKFTQKHQSQGAPDLMRRWHGPGPQLESTATAAATASAAVDSALEAWESAGGSVTCGTRGCGGRLRESWAMDYEGWWRVVGCGSCRSKI